MGRTREILAGLILAGVGFLFAFVLLELGVRWLHLIPDRFWQPDPILGARLVPEREGWWTQEEREFIVPIKINRLGLRDVERDYKKPQRSFRVLVLGDSFVEALQVPLESTFTQVLEKRINRGKTGPAVEVISAGVSGYGTASQLLYFREEGAKFSPDIVLLAFYPGNDVMNNSPILEKGFRPVFDGNGDVDHIVASKREQLSNRRSWLPRLEAYIFLRQIALRNRMISGLLTRLGLLDPNTVRKTPGEGGIPTAYGVYSKSSTADWDDAWQRTEKLIEQLRVEVETQGAQLVVAILSTRDQIYPGAWDNVLLSYPAMKGKDWDVDQPQRRMESLCQRQNLRCLSLAPIFRETAKESEEVLHFPQDGHWTERGHAVAAEAMEAFLREHQNF